MATLKAQFDFRVNDLLLTRSAYGANIEFRRGDYVIQIEFPTKQDGGEITGYRGNPSDPDVAYLELVRVGIVGNAAVGSEQFVGPDREQAVTSAIAFADSALALARKIVAQMLEWIRVRGQYWLCLHGSTPEWAGHDSLVDVKTGERLPTGATRSLRPRFFRDTSIALDARDLDSLQPLLCNEWHPLPIPEIALADALYLLVQTSDASRAVLSAAMACELKVKEVLRDRAPRTLQPVVELLFDSPRDWSLAAIALFDKGMAAIFGRSLRIDNRGLYKRIQKLFELRNEIAHRGRKMDKLDAQDVVFAAKSAFEWLERASEHPGQVNGVGSEHSQKRTPE